jgi:hypothetical protein
MCYGTASPEIIAVSSMIHSPVQLVAVTRAAQQDVGNHVGMLRKMFDEEHGGELIAI